MTSIFEGKPHKTRPFPIKTSVSWYTHTNIPMCQNPKVLKNTAGETIREIAAGEAASRQAVFFLNGIFCPMILGFWLDQEV